MKYLWILIAILSFVFFHACKTKPAPVENQKPVDLSELDKRWKTIDSLEKKGLVASAREEVKIIRDKALAAQHSGHLVKAILYENKYLNQLEEDAGIKAMQRAEADVNTYPEPAKSVMHSLLAQWYHYYLLGHLWQLRSTSEYTGPAGDDIRTWGIRHFVERINEHFKSSVQWPGLKTADIDDYLMLLTEGKETDELRPTLYDILINRAIEFYGGSENYLNQPVYAYTLVEPQSFLPASEFVKYNFSSDDTLDHTWQAIQWYQDLLSFRLTKPEEDEALLDADLRRLQFVYERGQVENKDSLYEKSLSRLADQYKDLPESALINYYIAQLYVQQGRQWQNDREGKYRNRLKEAKAIADKTISTFPDSYGAKWLKNLLGEIEQKSLSGSVESIQLPGEELLAKIDYQNLKEVFVKIVRLPESPRRWRQETWEGEKILSRLNQISPVKTWRQELKESDDFQPHTTEIGLPALEIGHYAIVLSDRENFDTKSSTTGTMLFTVSELGFWFLDDRREDQSVAVVNRRTGQPMQGVKVEFISMEYNASLRRQEEIKVGEGISDANGWVQSPKQSNQNLSLRLTSGKDEVFTDESYYTYRYGNENQDQQSTLFFTDRSIYRPGQKFYFKGYAVSFDQKRIPSIQANRKVEISLYNANGQEVASQDFTTNAYGTFAGHFDLPQGGLGGQMHIKSSYGDSHHFFQVEEYKRPKFEVTFDTLKTTARLNEDVTIKVFAKDYAGSSVGGAKVEYRVERAAYYPWWYGYWRKIMPYTDSRQVLATGRGITNEDGSFDITFNAKSKPGDDPKLMYRFETTVFVTDITGESHEETKTLVLNEQGYDVQIALPEEVSVDSLKKISIAATNSDGAPVNVNGTLEVAQISGPQVHKRDRLWIEPDVISISEADFKSRFPHYFFPGQEDKDKWPVQNTTGNKTIAVTGSTTVDASTLIGKPGHYRFTWKWKDAAGKELTITQYVLVYSPKEALPAGEMLHADYKTAMPGESVQVNLLTGLANPPRVVRIIERRSNVTTRDWMTLPTYNNTSVKVSEEDRGGIIMHYLAFYNNRAVHEQNVIPVPWTNKDLNVELKTWRDKLEPGDEETWTITVAGNKGEQVTAEMLMSMYDASLDAFIPHQWSMNLYPSISSRYMIQGGIPREVQYWGLVHHWDRNYEDIPHRQYRDLNSYGYFPEGDYYGGMPRGRGAGRDGVLNAVEAAPPSIDVQNSSIELRTEKMEEGAATGQAKDQAQTTGQQKETSSQPPLRTALDETVFFFPQLMTDAKGNLTFNFKMKEGLTRWKFQALAHTKELAFGLTTEEIVTQKQLMVFPNPPRFFRAGDTIDFQIKVSNLSATAQAGNAKLAILDAFSNEDVSAKWKLESGDKTIQVKQGGSTPASWRVQVPKDWTRPVKYQVYAKAGNFTDGEEALLPVVTNRVLITETLPLPIKSKETRTFVFRSMQENKSSTLDHHQYTVEMTTSPAWYAVQALPYLMEYPHECAEQIFSRLYANTLASHIANKYPGIKQVYDAWRQTGDDALLSNLEKNKELKSAMLEETPWVRDAMGETAQKKDIALLFEPNRLSMESRQAVEKLQEMQLSNGGFPWFPGGRDNWYITQYIVEGFGHLVKMGVPLKSGDGLAITQRAVPYIDARVVEWYEELQRLANQGKTKLEDHQISAIQVHYIYARSYFPSIQKSAKVDEVMKYIKSQMEKYWLQHGVYEQGLIALGSFRLWPDAPLSKEVLASLRERTIVHEELGRYWKIPSGYYWNESPVEMQSLMVELFQDMKVPQAEIDELRVWLLKQKQTTRWRSTKATAAAIYALLIHPDTWLTSSGIVEVKLGSESVINNSSAAQAGTGYVKETFTGNEIQNSWSTITVSNPNNHIAWGSVYWQFWEDLDKVKSTVDNNPLKVTRTLLLMKNEDRGAETTIAQGRKLNVGDKLIVRLTVETDRAMDYVHLKDLRASGFEPMDVISGYSWSGGVGYYKSTKDLATHFFMDRLPRGKFVIEYPVTVAQAGHYSEGLATLQCMYAPEYSDHSEGGRVEASMN